MGALDKFEAFASLNGPAFYGLPPNEIRISLLRNPLRVPERFGEGDNTVVPFRAGETLRWSLR
jgi:dihydroorotase